MTRSRNLPRLEKTCRACGAWVAEVAAPSADGGAVPLCWPCAHHHVDHAVPLELAATAECECLPWEIYPRDVYAPAGDAQFERRRDEVLKRRARGGLT